MMSPIVIIDTYIFSPILLKIPFYANPPKGQADCKRAQTSKSIGYSTSSLRFCHHPGIWETSMPQVSLKQKIIAYYLRTLNAESEAREHANLGAFLDTAENLLDCVNSFVAPLLGELSEYNHDQQYDVDQAHPRRVRLIASFSKSRLCNNSVSIC